MTKLYDPHLGLTRWETPKAIAIIIGATATLFGVLAGLAGYELARAPPAAGLTIIFQPGSIQVTLPAARPSGARP
jgi:hypothetical protein